MGAGLEEHLERIYSILGNSYRRKIIYFLGERGEASFTELKKHLGTSTGNLYYNLDGLAGFVTKNERKKYQLTSEGQRLYKFLVENEARLRTLLESSGRSRLLQRLLGLLVPEEHMATLYGQRALSASAAALSLAVMLSTPLLSGRAFFMLDVIEVAAAPYFGVALSSLGVACLVAVLVLVSRLLGGAGKVSLSFVGMVLLSLLPLEAAVMLSTLIDDVLLRSLLHRVVQALILGPLTSSVKISERLPGDRAFISVFAAFYVSFVAGMVLQRLIP